MLNCSVKMSQKYYHILDIAHNLLSEIDQVFGMFFAKCFQDRISFCRFFLFYLWHFVFPILSSLAQVFTF